MVLRQITEAFLVQTEPASSMANPAHIHMTIAPHMRKEKVLMMNWVSSLTRPHEQPTATQRGNPGIGALLPPRRQPGSVVE